MPALVYNGWLGAQRPLCGQVRRTIRKMSKHPPLAVSCHGPKKKSKRKIPGFVLKPQRDTTPRGTLLPRRSPQPTCREAHEAANPHLRKRESAAGRRQEKVLLLSCFVLVVISIEVCLPPERPCWQ
ncbi:unnamed protein product [Ectocarpus sp. 12 AP-2014]